jgi:hypothetical protein
LRSIVPSIAPRTSADWRRMMSSTVPSRVSATGWASSSLRIIQLSLTASHTSRVIPVRTMRALWRACSTMLSTLPGLSRSRSTKLNTLVPA